MLTVHAGAVCWAGAGAPAFLMGEGRPRGPEVRLTGAHVRAQPVRAGSLAYKEVRSALPDTHGTFCSPEHRLRQDPCKPQPPCSRSRCPQSPTPAGPCCPAHRVLDSHSRVYSQTPRSVTWSHLSTRTPVRSSCSQGHPHPEDTESQGGTSVFVHSSAGCLKAALLGVLTRSSCMTQSC